MQLPALSIQQPDVARSLLTAEAIKSARTRNKLAETSLAQTQQKQDLLRQVLGGGSAGTPDGSSLIESAPGTVPVPEADAVAPTNMMGGLNMPLLKKLAVIDPRAAKGILDFATTADKTQVEAARTGAEAMAKPILFLKSLPEDQRPAAYQQLRAQIEASGQKLQNPLPEQYDERWADRIALQAMTMDQVLKMTGQAGERESFGLNPVWGTDKNDNPVLLQLSNRGGMQQVQLPPGVTPRRGQTSRVDLGDRYGVLDANGTIIGYLPKGIAPQQSIDEKGNRIIVAPGVPGGAPTGGVARGVPASGGGGLPAAKSATAPAASAALAAPPTSAAPAQAAQAGPSVTKIPPSAAQQRAAQSALQGFERQANIVSDTVDEALKLVGPLSTGYGAFLADLPNTDAGKLRNALDTIRANVGFDKLQQMRDASPTGGALGQVSETENRLLQAVNGALDPKQSDQLVANLKKIKTLYGQVMEERRGAFAKDFGGQAPKAEGSGNESTAKTPADMSDDELKKALGL